MDISRARRLAEDFERSATHQMALRRDHVVLMRAHSAIDRSKHMVAMEIRRDQRLVHKNFQLKLHQSKLRHARMVGDRELEKKLRLEGEVILNTNLTNQDQESVLSHIWACGERQVAWANQESAQRSGLDSRCISAVRSENWKSGRVLFPVEKSVVFSNPVNQSRGLSSGNQSSKKKPRPLSTVSIAKAQINPIRPATAHELRTISRALSLGGAGVELTGIRKKKPSVYVTKPEADDDEQESEKEENADEHFGFERSSGNVNTSEKRCSMSNKFDPGNGKYTITNKNHPRKVQGKDYENGCNKSDSENKDLFNKSKGSLTKIIQNGHLDNSSDSGDEVDYALTLFTSPGRCKKSEVKFIGDSKDQFLNGRQTFDQPLTGSSVSTAVKSESVDKKREHNVHCGVHKSQKHVQIQCNSYVNNRRPETAPDNMKYVMPDVIKESDVRTELGLKSENDFENAQEPQKPTSGVVRSSSNYSRFTRSRSILRSGSKSRSLRRNGLFEKEEGPSLLEIHKLNVELADYEKQVREFSEKIVPLKAGEKHITDYYVSRILEEQSRGKSHDARAPKFVSRAPEVEQEAEGACASQVPNLTFRTVNLKLDDASRTTIHESFY